MQDIVSFTSLSQQCEPEDIMNMLHTLFSRFDALSTDMGVFKVETIGELEGGLLFTDD
jgi:class 3 adenylate cyclase